MPATRFSLPISCAARARWLSNSTSLRSSSSICLRQSAMSIASTFDTNARDRTQSHAEILNGGMLTANGGQLFYEFCHRSCLFARILFNRLNDSAAHDRCIGEAGYSCYLLRSRNSKADRHGKVGDFPNASNEILRVFRHLLASARDACT